jgi:PTS system nitrogen regulatory IIA component
LKIQDILQKNAILPDLKAVDKIDLLKQMAYYLTSLYTLKDPAMITQRILDRESDVTTGIGFGIAIPHARIEGIEKVYMIVGRCISGIDFSAIDENPVHILFMMISPKNTSLEHTKILSSLSKIMSVSDIRQRMFAAASVDEFLAALIEGENKYVD